MTTNPAAAALILIANTYPTYLFFSPFLIAFTIIPIPQSTYR